MKEIRIKILMNKNMNWKNRIHLQNYNSLNKIIINIKYNNILSNKILFNLLNNSLNKITIL
jgi:hypothetical protein